ncbi:MAG: hypothetical protein LBR65_05470 [Culturomica sp.]|nr:hypothetical protein [Culturomica sp.]
MENNREELLKAGFIPEIYNYCDRWCEKCGFGASCLSYRLEQKAEETEDELPLEQILQNPLPLWDQIRNYLRSGEGGDEFREEYSEALWEEESEEGEGEEPDTEYSAGMLDMLRVSLVYEAWAEHTLEETYSALDDLTESEREKADAVTAATEVIDWQLDVINPKLRRAIYDYYRREERSTNGNLWLDYNGSAKVALLSMEQSEQAWRQLRELLPVLEREGAHLLVILSELREDILKQFPAAAEFKRPGFDD